MIYDIAYKTRYIAKPLGITFNKTDGYIRKYYGIKYLALFHLRQLLIELDVLLCLKEIFQTFILTNI